MLRDTESQGLDPRTGGGRVRVLRVRNGEKEEHPLAELEGRRELVRGTVPQEAGIVRITACEEGGGGGKEEEEG